jgi:hypothetical protein
MVQWYAVNRVALNPARGKADYAALLHTYQLEDTLYSATIANIPELAPPDNDEKTSIGFFWKRCFTRELRSRGKAEIKS